MPILSPNAEDRVQRECTMQGVQDQIPQKKIGQVTHDAHSANNAATAAASSAASPTAAHSRHRQAVVTATPAATPAAAVVVCWPAPVFFVRLHCSRPVRCRCCCILSGCRRYTPNGSLSDCPKSCSPLLHANSFIQSRDQCAARADRKQGEPDLLAQKKTGQACHAPAPVASSSASPPACANSPSSPQCAVRARWEAVPPHSSPSRRGASDVPSLAVAII